MRHLGKNVRLLRAQRGITQIALAKMAGVSVPTIKGIEQGKRCGQLLTIEKIAKALEVSPSFLQDNLKVVRDDETSH